MAAFDGLKEAMGLERKLKFVQARSDLPPHVKASLIVRLREQIVAVLSQGELAGLEAQGGAVQAPHAPGKGAGRP